MIAAEIKRSPVLLATQNVYKKQNAFNPVWNAFVSLHTRTYYVDTSITLILRIENSSTFTYIRLVYSNRKADILRIRTLYVPVHRLNSRNCRWLSSEYLIPNTYTVQKGVRGWGWTKWTNDVTYSGARWCDGGDTILIHYSDIYPFVFALIANTAPAPAPVTLR